MPPETFMTRCRLLASAAAAVFLVPSAITFAQAPSGAITPPSSKMDAKVTQMEKIDTKVGGGIEATKGKIAVVHYTGWLYDPGAADKKGKKFDSSRDTPSPFSFPLGAGKVIRGWDEGVVGMRVGGKRTLIIPAELHGERGAGGYSAGRDVVFDVELLEVLEVK